MTWTQTTLSAVSDIQTGPFGSQLHAADYVVSGTPAIMPQNIVNGRISTNGIARVSNKDIKRLVKYCVQPGDIVFSRRVDVERHSLITANESTWLCGTGCLRVRPNSSLIKPEYLHYYLSTPASCAWISGHAHGSTMPNLNTTILGETPIKFPNRDMQIRICGILTALDAKIDCNSRINDNLEQQTQALFELLFVENADPSWRLGTIEDLGAVVGGSTPSKAKPEYYTDNGIAWITPKDLSIDKSKFISHGENDITELGLKNSSATIMPEGTVLFSSRAPIGYIAIAGGDVTTNQGFKSVVPKANIGTAYVYFFLKHNLPIIEGMASGSTFKEVSGSTMKRVPAMIPDSETLTRFTDFCAPLFAQQRVLEAQNRELAALRDSLLPRLMSGEIDVSNIQL